MKFGGPKKVVLYSLGILFNAFSFKFHVSFGQIYSQDY